MTQPPRNVADLVRAAAAARPDHPALVSGGTTTTWSALDAAVDRAAAALRGRGLQEGDRVGLHLPNVPAFAVAWFGALRAGLVAVPVGTAYTRPEVAHVLGDSGARAVVTTAPEVVEGLAEVLTPDLLDADGVPPQTSRGGEHLAAVLYTSGTSGRPRGAMLSHRALLANLDQTARLDPPVASPDDVVLLVLPLTHVYALGTGLGSVASQAGTAVLVDRFDPVETLAEVRRAGVTVVLGAPPLWVAWSLLPELPDAVASVRLALSGAAPLPAAVLQRVREATGRPVHEGYGLTETAPVLTSTLVGGTPKPGSVGRPLPGVELRLVGEDGRPVLDGDPGEVVVRGENLFSGYWPDGADGPDADGWWPTGDIGFLDAEGDLHLVDRTRELVLVSGFNVYPREVEDVLLGHPDVVEAAVLGEPHPYTGETVTAFVVLRPGATATPDDLVAHCARSLARFKCPTSVRVVGQLPHSATGKVSKGRLREQGGAPAPGIS